MHHAIENSYSLPPVYFLATKSAAVQIYSTIITKYSSFEAYSYDRLHCDTIQYP